MSFLKKPSYVKLIISLIYADDKKILDSVIHQLQKIYNNIDSISQRLNFNHTDYYYKELGEPLFRKLLSFKDLIDRASLPDIKIYTNEIEREFSINDKRTINIDPSYISLENFILATGKNYTHRIYLRNGIYADLTLIYKDKSFQPLDWTYPDYASPQIISIMNKLRDVYKLQIS